MHVPNDRPAHMSDDALTFQTKCRGSLWDPKTFALKEIKPPLSRLVPCLKSSRHRHSRTFRTAILAWAGAERAFAGKV